MPEPRKQPTLHEAMRQILQDTPGRTSSYLEISEANRRRKLYLRGDGTHPGAGQVRARARQYPELFERLGGGKVRLLTPAPKGKKGK